MLTRMSHLSDDFFIGYSLSDEQRMKSSQLHLAYRNLTPLPQHISIYILSDRGKTIFLIIDLVKA